VIPAGGAGTRLWPWSNQQTPKHLLDLTGDGRSLLQQTYDRVAPLADAVFVLTEERQLPMIRAQLPQAELIIEPTARGTANAYGLAAFEIASRDPDAMMFSTPADHVIQGVEEYRATVRRAIRTAESSGKLVTIGLEPTYPSTGFGYIQVGAEEGEAFEVLAFVEKPTLRHAEEYLAAGGYYWNLAMFTWRASAFLEELRKVAPQHHSGLLEVRAGKRPYAELPMEAIDYAVMEKTDKIALVPLNAGWDDVSVALHVSAYSLASLARSLAPLMTDGGSIVGLDFDNRQAWPAYDWMGVAKAGLESTSRYLARDLGPEGIRCNLVSAGPLKSLAAKAIPGFEQLESLWSDRAPLGWDEKDQEPTARAVCALLSDFFPATTGEIVHVDGGFHAMGA